MDTETVLSNYSIDEATKILTEGLTYFCFDDPTDWNTFVVQAHDIKPLSAEKRVRVYCNQFLYDVIENVTLRNYLNKAGIYYIYGENLREKFPDYDEQILQAYLTFWQSMQTKLKKLSKK